MSWNNVISANILIDLAHEKENTMSKDKPPKLIIDQEYLTSVAVKLNIQDSTTARWGITSSVEHPTFAANRTWLADNDYIDRVDNCWNGDTVLSPFYLNDHLFNIGDTFSCADALRHKLKA